MKYPIPFGKVLTR